MSVTPARRIAYEVLRRVEAEGAYAADLLHARLEEKVKRTPLGSARDRDAALTTELTLGVLRWRRLLDFLIERQTGKLAEALDLEVVLALRLGLYQLRFLTRVPARAAVNESVELVKWAGKRSAASLVNAVLRHAPREPAEELVPRNLPPADRLGILHSHPTWLVERWLARFGEARTVPLLEANNRPPKTTCALTGAASREEVLAALEQAGFEVQDGRWLRTTLVLRSGPRSPALTRTLAWRRGWISVQDEASQMIPFLLQVGHGHSVLDLCAAPGGKTATLARAAGNDALVVAGDRHLHRLRAMRAQLARVGVRGVKLVALDATASVPFRQRFDRILVDAPCSGTGTLARNPEIRWRLRPEDLADFHQRQVALLSNAIAQIAPRGRLAYATCSLEREENEQVIQEAIAKATDVKLVSPSGALAPHLLAGASERAPRGSQKDNAEAQSPQRIAEAETMVDADGCFRTFPPEHSTDGFFAATFLHDRS